MLSSTEMMTCETCGSKIAINALGPHRCDHCGDICWPETTDALRPAVGWGIALALAAPIWILLAGLIAFVWRWM